MPDVTEKRATTAPEPPTRHDSGRWATVACPRCGASIGEPCRGTTAGAPGHVAPLRRPHWERFTAARADPNVRGRGKWASTPAALRGTPERRFGLPRPLHAALDALADSGVILSSLVRDLLTAHPSVAPHYGATEAAHAAWLEERPGDVDGARKAAEEAFRESRRKAL